MNPRASSPKVGDDDDNDTPQPTRPTPATLAILLLFTMVRFFTVDEVMDQGLAHADKRSQERVKRSTKVDRFKDLYGSSPLVCAQIWDDLQTTDIEAIQVTVRNGEGEKELKLFLHALFFLKKYPTENDSSGRFEFSDRTGRDTKWYYVRKLQALQELKITWPGDWTAAGDIPVFLVSVDGVHCRIYEPQHGEWSKNPAYYSHKFQQSGVAYEVALSVFQNKCVSLNGPFPAGTSDTTIFRDGIRDKIPVGCKAIVDNGYKGKDPKYSKPNPLDSPALRKFKRRARSRQECFNARLKNFHCLSEKFRHGFTKHKLCFEAVAVVCQYQLELGSPLFDV